MVTATYLWNLCKQVKRLFLCNTATSLLQPLPLVPGVTSSTVLLPNNSIPHSTISLALSHCMSTALLYCRVEYDDELFILDENLQGCLKWHMHITRKPSSVTQLAGPVAKQ